MEIRDLIVTPLVLLLVYGVAYIARPYVTDPVNRQYFLTALSLRIGGALALGFIYQFYYHGGDTYNFHTHGSRHIWEAFWDSPEKGVRLFFANGTSEQGIYKYASRIPFFRDPSSYAIIKISAFFDLFTFSSYSATAICFAIISFVGAWALFLTFYEQDASAHRWIAIATFFMPSVFFWGSGLLKDTITLSCLGIATYLFQKIFIQKRVSVTRMIMLVLVLYLIFVVKKYILLCYMPAVILWLYTSSLRSVRSGVLRLMVLPFGLVITMAVGYYTVLEIGRNDKRYSVEMLAATARETAYDIAYQTGREAGSTYSLGELDGSFGSMVRLAPQAINVALFRPYLWEVRNPLMLMSALESLSLLLLALFLVLRNFRYLAGGLADPNVIFCLVFSITFAFAVGVSTFNFGTLSRYKIPLIPFFLIALIFIHRRSKSARKLETFAFTE